MQEELDVEAEENQRQAGDAVHESGVGYMAQPAGTQAPTLTVPWDTTFGSQLQPVMLLAHVSALGMTEHGDEAGRQSSSA
jgi:hypothetical protein